MKHTKLNLLAIATLAGLMACGPMALAQDNPPPPQTPAAPPAPGGDNGAPPPRPNRRGGMGAGMQAALDKLDLTADQKEKVGAAMKTMRDKMMALRTDTTVAQEDKRAKAKEISDAFDTALKGILTPDQWTKFAEERKNMRPGRPPGAGAPPPPPDAPKPPDASKN